MIHPSRLLPSLLLLAACQSVQFRPVPDLSVPVEDPAKARVYVLRPPVFLDRVGMTIGVMENGEEPIGLLEAGDHLVWEREPGPVVIGTSEGLLQWDPLSGQDVRLHAADLPLDLEAGEVCILMVHTVGYLLAPAPPLEEGAEAARSHPRSGWELRRLGPEDGALLLARTDTAREGEYQVPGHPHAGPGFVFQVPPGVEVDTRPRGIGFQLGFGGAWCLQWSDPAPSGTSLDPALGREQLLSALRDSSRVEVLRDAEVRIEPRGGAPRTARYLLIQRSGAATYETREGLVATKEHSADVLEGYLLFFHGRRGYILSTQSGLLAHITGHSFDPAIPLEKDPQLDGLKKLLERLELVPEG